MTMEPRSLELLNMMDLFTIPMESIHMNCRHIRLRLVESWDSREPRNNGLMRVPSTRNVIYSSQQHLRRQLMLKMLINSNAKSLLRVPMVE